MNEKISCIITAFNEEDNVVELYDQINTITQELQLMNLNFYILKMEVPITLLKT